MNLLKSVCLSVLLMAVATMAQSAEPYRTNINPALLYYQAFSLAPDLSGADRRHLFETEWRSRPLESRFEELIKKYDNYCKLIGQAAHARVPCDWGIDLTQGPDALFPGLATARAAVQTARLRVRWHLAHGRQAEARDELLAALVLGRNLSRDGVMISTMVQIATENTVISTVAENFFQFTPETLAQLAAGFDASPARGTLRQCMATERASFYDWFLAKFRAYQAETPGNDVAALAKARALLARTMGDKGKPDPEFADEFIATSGGTLAGLMARCQELEPLYDELTALLALPYDQFVPAAKTFDEKLAQHPNPLAGKLLPAVARARAKEFGSEVKLAMLRAAFEERLRGRDGFQKVMDPSGHGPFELTRLVVGGVDRGFVVKSKLTQRDFDEVLVFADDSGPPVYVDGKDAGKPLVKERSGR